MMFLSIIKKSLTILFIFLLLSSIVNAEKIYKHVDENGKVTYSDKPVDKTSKKVELTGNDVSGQRKKEALKLSKKMINSKNRLINNLNEDKADKAKKEKEQAKLAQLCERVKKQLELLNMPVRLVRTKKSEDGKRKQDFISNETREKEKAELSEFIKANCKN